MATNAVVLVPLREAYLCVECETIGNDARKCWACTSQSVIPLGKVLNTNPETKGN